MNSPSTGPETLVWFLTLCALAFSSILLKPVHRKR